MTLNAVIALILRFLRNSTDFQADYMTVVEDRPIMSVNYCLPVLLLAKTITLPAARSLCDSWASCLSFRRLMTLNILVVVIAHHVVEIPILEFPAANFANISVVTNGCVCVIHRVRWRKTRQPRHNVACSWRQWYIHRMLIDQLILAGSWLTEIKLIVVIYTFVFIKLLLMKWETFYQQ